MPGPVDISKLLSSKWIAFLVLLAHVGLLTHGAINNFPVVDEIAHLPSGVSHWKFQRFEMYRVNPPLVRLVAGFPAWVMNTEYNWDLYTFRTGSRPEFAIGLDRLHALKLATQKDFIFPRLVCIPFSLMGAVILSLWVRAYFGALSGNMCCVLWCFCPNILAHAQTIVPDVAAISFGVLASVAFSMYVKTPSYARSNYSGVALGAALLTKLSWLPGLFIMPATCFGCLLWVHFRSRSKTVRQGLLHMINAVVVAMAVLNTGYLFEGSFATIGSYEFCSQLLGGPGSSPANLGNRFKDTWMQHIPVPFPKNYVLGVDYLKFEVESKMWSFLLGEWRYGSWPHYYIYTTLMKTPEGTLIGAAVGLALTFRRFFLGLLSSDCVVLLLLLTIPAAAVFASVSLQGGFNHHHRYVLCVYPPMFVFCSALVQEKFFMRRLQVL